MSWCVFYDAKIVLIATIHAEFSNSTKVRDIVIKANLVYGTLMIHPRQFNYNHLLVALRHSTVEIFIWLNKEFVLLCCKSVGVIRNCHSTEEQPIERKQQVRCKTT